MWQDFGDEVLTLKLHVQCCHGWLALFPVIKTSTAVHYKNNFAHVATNDFKGQQVVSDHNTIVMLKPGYQTSFTL